MSESAEIAAAGAAIEVVETPVAGTVPASHPGPDGRVAGRRRRVATGPVLLPEGSGSSR